VIRHLCVENDFPLASYQPRFIIDQVRSACKFEGIHPTFRLDLVKLALSNLFTKDSPGFRGDDVARAPPPSVGQPRSGFAETSRRLS
jgi:hypothetical protein